jgi:hypothetical protein
LEKPDHEKTLSEISDTGASMIRALVFVISLGLMISSGLLFGTRSVTATDNAGNQPPSLQKLEQDSYTYLSPPEENGESLLPKE